MKKCKYCQSDIDVKAKVCPVCKKRLNSTSVVIAIVIGSIIAFFALIMVLAVVVALFSFQEEKVTTTTIKTTTTKERVNKVTTTTTKPTTQKEVVYKVTGNKTGEYGKRVVLNANTDAPATKYLYKIPAGTYIVTTNANYVISIAVVKDEPVLTGTSQYPEELSYVTDPLNITGSDNYVRNTVTKEREITLSDDESLLINGRSEVTLTKKN